MVRYINIHFIGKEEVTVSINIQYALKFKSYLNLMKIYNGFDQQYVISLDVVKFDEKWHRKMCLQSSHTTK